MPPSEVELFARAFRSAHGETLQSSARKELAAKLTKQSEQAIGRATKRTDDSTKLLVGEELALENRKADFRRLGIPFDE